MSFSESAYLILKAPNQSVNPLMTEVHLALSRLVLKARKELGLPPWEVGNLSLYVLYVSPNFLKLFNVCLYLMCVCMLLTLSLHLVHYESKRV